MNTIIEPVPVELIKAELTKSKKLEDTNRGHNELYVVTWQDSPNVVTEVGRLRELTFREAGGSTGNAVDLDEYDKMSNPYKQLIVWDPDNEAIIGGYRFLLGADAKYDDQGQPIMASSHQFHFSQKFISDYLPHVIELGRNFVTPEYQSSKNGAKSIFAMDNLWDGLVAPEGGGAALRLVPAQRHAAFPLAVARDGETGHHAACGCRCQPVAALLRPGRCTHQRCP